MRTSEGLEVTPCPACLLVLQEYGATEYERAVRLADPIQWCGHHRRVAKELRSLFGSYGAMEMLANLETFVMRFRPGSQRRDGWGWGWGWGAPRDGGQPV